MSEVKHHTVTSKFLVSHLILLLLGPFVVFLIYLHPVYAWAIFPAWLALLLAVVRGQCVRTAQNIPRYLDVYFGLSIVGAFLAGLLISSADSRAFLHDGNWVFVVVALFVILRIARSIIYWKNRASNAKPEPGAFDSVESGQKIQD